MNKRESDNSINFIHRWIILHFTFCFSLLNRKKLFFIRSVLNPIIKLKHIYDFQSVLIDKMLYHTFFIIFYQKFVLTKKYICFV